MRARKNAAIIAAAVQIFLKKGFESASMDEIASAAGVSKRTVYQHFANKEQLFQKILTEHWQDTMSASGKLLFNAEHSVTVNLKHFAKVFLDFLYQPQTMDLFRLLISESARFPALAQSLVINGKAPFTQQLIQFLEQQKKAGRLSIKDTERAAAFFMGQLKEYHFWPMMLGFVSASALPKKDALVTEAVAMFEKFYLNAKSGDPS
jgi:AcrR family transcriptional regulator